MTTTPDFRKSCAELIKIVEEHCNPDDYALPDVADILSRARAELATPPPEPPTDKERLADFTKWLAREMPPNTIIGDPLWWAPRIWRVALERWGR